MSCLDVPIRSFYNVNKSCKFIMGNPPIVQGLKSSQFRGTRVVRLTQVPGHQGCQTHLVKSSLVGFSQVENQYKQRDSLSIFHTITHTQLQCKLRKKKFLGLERKRLLLSGYHLTVFGAFQFGVDSISKEVAGFSPLWFP